MRELHPSGPDGAAAVDIAEERAAALLAEADDAAEAMVALDGFVRLSHAGFRKIIKCAGWAKR